MLQKSKLSTHVFIASTAFLLFSTAIQAQTVFRIVGADGKVTFSDKPPQSTVAAQNVTATTKGGRTVDLLNTTLPFELRQVASKYPVTLYSADNCGPCASGRNLLASRGVPFTERTVTTSDDSEALRRISGDGSLPLLTVGGQKIKGYSDTEWTQFLDAAGYPSTSKLPASYRNPPAAPLVAVNAPAPAAAPAEAAQVAARPAPAAPAADAGSNPAGIKF